MKRFPVICTLITVALLLLWPIQPVRALTFTNPMGGVQHANEISGTVISVNQRARSLALRWTMGTSSYEQTFVVREATIYKNGSWADIKKGVHVKIEGKSDAVDTVEFAK
jgi:hypothetical protein